jgi:hypothetical protein
VLRGNPFHGQGSFGIWLTRTLYLYHGRGTKGKRVSGNCVKRLFDCPSGHIAAVEDAGEWLFEIGKTAPPNVVCKRIEKHNRSGSFRTLERLKVIHNFF